MFLELALDILKGVAYYAVKMLRNNTLRNIKEAFFQHQGKLEHGPNSRRTVS